MLPFSEWLFSITYLFSSSFIGAFLPPPPPQLVAVHLVDSHYCSDPGKFISIVLTSLSTMVQIELPHINILSKVDLMQQFGKLGKHCSIGQ